MGAIADLERLLAEARAEGTIIEGSATAAAHAALITALVNHADALLEVAKAELDRRAALAELAQWQNAESSTLPFWAEVKALKGDASNYCAEMDRIVGAFWQSLRDRVTESQNRLDAALSRLTDEAEEERC